MNEQEDKDQATAPTPPAVADKVRVAGEHDELRKIIEYFETNGTSLLIATAVVAVLVLGVVFFRRHKEATRAEAAAMLFKVQSVQDLDNMVSKYDSTPAAQLALLKLSKAHFDAGSYEIAGRKYDEFTQKYPKHAFAPVATLGKLYCLEALGKTEEALAGFSAFLTEHPKHFMAAQALFGKGRCLEALGRTKEAKTLYEDLLAQDRKGPWAMRAEEQISSLKRKLGERSDNKAEEKSTANESTNAVAPAAALP